MPRVEILIIDSWLPGTFAICQRKTFSPHQEKFHKNFALIKTNFLTLAVFCCCFSQSHSPRALTMYFEKKTFDIVMIPIWMEMKDFQKIKRVGKEEEMSTRARVNFHFIFIDNSSAASQNSSSFRCRKHLLDFDFHFPCAVVTVWLIWILDGKIYSTSSETEKKCLAESRDWAQIINCSMTSNIFAVNLFKSLTQTSVVLQKAAQIDVESGGAHTAWHIDFLSLSLRRINTSQIEQLNFLSLFGWIMCGIRKMLWTWKLSHQTRNFWSPFSISSLSLSVDEFEPSQRLSPARHRMPKFSSSTHNMCVCDILVEVVVRHHHYGFINNITHFLFFSSDHAVGGGFGFDGKEMRISFKN